MNVARKTTITTATRGGSILRRKKNYGKKFNYFTMQKNLIFRKKSRKKKPKSFKI
jgi:hypothetical protein